MTSQLFRCMFSLRINHDRSMNNFAVCIHFCYFKFQFSLKFQNNWLGIFSAEIFGTRPKAFWDDLKNFNYLKWWAYIRNKNPRDRPSSCSINHVVLRFDIEMDNNSEFDCNLKFPFYLFEVFSSENSEYLKVDFG